MSPTLFDILRLIKYLLTCIDLCSALQNFVGFSFLPHLNRIRHISGSNGRSMDIPSVYNSKAYPPNLVPHCFPSFIHFLVDIAQKNNLNYWQQKRLTYYISSYFWSRHVESVIATWHVEVMLICAMTLYCEVILTNRGEYITNWSGIFVRILGGIDVEGEWLGWTKCLWASLIYSIDLW